MSAKNSKLEHFLQIAMRVPAMEVPPKFAQSITARPVFHLDVDSELIEDLGNVACTHYDAHCKSYAQQGGLLWGWRNRIWWWEDQILEKQGPVVGEDINKAVLIDDPDDKRPQVEASWDDLDTLLKICEMRAYTPLKNAAKLNEFIRSIRTAMDQWRKHQKNWELLL